MPEKEVFLDRWDREFKTTLKILKAYPKEKSDLTEHPVCLIF